jgi:NAD(P)-dependent dehydrogenase (short-subunit alcohol dehydrogenase family)
VKKQHAGNPPTCVIAGAGPRLGLAIAKRYAREGFSCYMLSRTPECLQPKISPARAQNLRVFALQCDVRSDASVQNALTYIRKQESGCDVLIYNAFKSSIGRASSLEPEQALSEFHVNVAGALAFLNLVVDEMRSRASGTILFSGCGLAHLPSAEKTSLSISKAALRALMDCLAQEVDSDGIRVGMVTVNGTMPNDELALAQIAELYWQIFVSSDHDLHRELSF